MFELNKKTKVFVTGAGGMLGEAIYEIFSERTSFMATDIDLNEPWLDYADVRDYESLHQIISSYQPDLLINLAALTSLEYCELNPEEAWSTNALGQENMALIANQMDIPVVYISTAGIFDGNKAYYNDFDQPSPLSIYGKSKYYGELYTLRSAKKHFIFRAGWMMGGGIKKDKKFINKIFRQIQEGKKELFIVDDKLGTPTYTKSFAEGIFKIIQTEQYGLYNQVCQGDCNRYEAAKEFIRLLGFENEIRIKKVSSDFFNKEYFAPRPESERLVNLKLKMRNLDFMPDWKEALREYVREFKL